MVSFGAVAPNLRVGQHCIKLAKTEWSGRNGLPISRNIIAEVQTSEENLNEITDFQTLVYGPLCMTYAVEVQI